MCPPTDKENLERASFAGIQAAYGLPPPFISVPGRLLDTNDRIS